MVGFTVLYGGLAVVMLGLVVRRVRAGLPDATADAGFEHERRVRAGARVLGEPMELTTVWFALIAVLWIGYFVLEGFDFGVGILLPILGRDEPERRAMLRTIGPVWDGNEVWVLVAGGATFAAFPEWYATLFSGFYLALFLILVALIVRGIGIEYRNKRGDASLALALGPRDRDRQLPAGAAVGRRVRQHRGRRADRRRQAVHRQPAHAAQPVRAAGRADHAAAVRDPRPDLPGPQDRRRDPGAGERAGPAGRAGHGRGRGGVPAVGERHPRRRRLHGGGGRGGPRLRGRAAREPAAARGLGVRRARR